MNTLFNNVNSVRPLEWFTSQTKLTVKHIKDLGNSQEGSEQLGSELGVNFPFMVNHVGPRKYVP